MAGRVVIFGWAQSAHIQRWALAIVKRGYQVRLISLGGEPLESVETFCLPRRNQGAYFSQAGRAVSLAREFKPDLIHVHYAGGFGYWGLKCRFAPLLVSVWGADIVDLPRKLWHRWLIRRILRRAVHVSATSQFLRKITIDLSPTVTEKISVIPFGVNLPNSPRPLPAGPPVRLCFLKMHREKYGPHILLRALGSAMREVPELELTMAGDGPMRPELERLTDELGLSGKVHFVGLIPNDQIYSLLDNHHIMVMPSVVNESFGVAVLEASACGRPVIASRVGGVSEVVRDGETGVLVPPDDMEALVGAIVKLARDLSRCEAMGQAGRQMVQASYEWSHSVDMMTNLYEDIINA